MGEIKVDFISLRIDAPTGSMPPGRGFYQLEEDALQVQVGEFSHDRRAFSFLEAKQVRLDTDRMGRLMMIEVTLPRRHWPIGERVELPTISEPADIRWLDFCASSSDPEILTNTDRSLLLLTYGSAPRWHWYQLADTVFVQVSTEGRLLAILIDKIQDDLAGQAIRGYRKRATETELSQNGRIESDPER